MPTRTINLKMVLGSKDETAELRGALWSTHTQINLAVAEIEKILLLCRGNSYWTLDNEGKEIQIPESQVVSDALKMARAAQRRNGKCSVGSDKEIIDALRFLYEQIVPSRLLDDKNNPLKGDAQSIGTSYAGPLFDPDTCRIEDGKVEESCGPFAETASKRFEKLPKWIIRIDKSRFDKSNPTQFKHKSSNDEVYYQIDLDEANRWYALESTQSLLSENKAFNKDGWKKAKEREDNGWAINFAKKQMELSTDSRIAIREKLWKELRLLPIGTPFFDKNSVGNLWNRLAVRLSVAHLLSWESWNHSTRKEHASVLAQRDKFLNEFNRLEAQFVELREYERARHAELQKNTSVNIDRPFKIGRRAIRAWDRIREAWMKEGVNQEKREQVLRDIQTRLRGKFGDPDLIFWLAADGREHLWRETDCLNPLVRLNIAERLLEKRREYSLMTFADARQHPRWAMYEPSGGTNLRHYEIRKTETGVQVKLPLLIQKTDGTWKEKDFIVRLAPSGQLSNLLLEQDVNGKERFKYKSSHQEFEGIPGGAELLFDRPYLEHADRTNDSLSRKPGPVWFKLTLDVQSQAPKEWLDGKGKVATPSEVHHFKTALSNKSKHADKLKPGLRVLSIDLGLRSFASCSVFELVQGKPEKGLYFPAADDRSQDDPRKLWSKHVRSFKLTLSGETPTKLEEQVRKAAMDKIHSLRRDIRRLKDILRLSVMEDDAKRDELIQAVIASFDDEKAESALNKEMFNGVSDRKFRSTQELWQRHCQSYYDKAETAVSERFGQWRSRTRPKPASWEDWHKRRGYHGGKSIWMIEYLDAVRKLILSWNLRGRVYGEINRQDKKQFGTVASNLLQHINKLKEDRNKAGADLIIQAARGFVPVKDGRGWLKKHDPCRVILFEDLARYRFRVDRPRRENSQLMKWSHREIITETTMQAELYGIVIETTAAGFSSRYLASNGAPGVRCRYLWHGDFDKGLPKPHVVYELEWMLSNAKQMDFVEKQTKLGNKIRPGIWVPWNGGELFATLDGSNGFAHAIHADINAAQNLQRRFWSRCGEAYRITCKELAEGADRYMLDKAPGVRLLGALQQLEHGGAQFQLVPDPNSKNGNEHYIMQLYDAKKRLKAGVDESDNAESELEEALAEFVEESNGGRVTFFRDPSGALFDAKHWVPSKIYWSAVKTQVWKALTQQRNAKKMEQTTGADIPF